MRNHFCYGGLLVLLLMAASARIFPSSQTKQGAQGHLAQQEQGQPQEVRPEDPLGRSTPHGTVVGFLRAAQSGQYADAAQYLQLTRSERALKGERMAQELQELMDQAFVGRVEPFNNSREGSPGRNPAGNHETIGTFRVEDSETNVDLVRVADARAGEIWLFSSQTLATIPDLASRLDTERIESRLPAFLATRRIFHTPFWRLLAFVLLIPVSYGLAWGILRLARAAARGWAERRHHPLFKDFLTVVAAPTMLILSVILHRVGVYFLNISLLLRVYYIRIVALLLLAGIAWAGYRLIDAWGAHARTRALSRSGPGNGSVVLLGQRVLKAILVVSAVLIALSIFGVNITAAVAGLGIGSIAFAFAAQKTLENLLGGISILGDQVIRVGETCRIGDHIGKVEDISLRSTRIRTLERTELSVPNGQLANMNVENISRSDKSLFCSTLELSRETPPDRLERLLKEMRALLNDCPEVDPEGTRVRFVGFGESSLEVEVFCHIRTTKLLEFLAIREDLLLRIMKLVAATGVEFAIPARSLSFREQTDSDQRAGQGASVPTTRSPFETAQRRVGS